jgi:uracil-DNA glycosylase
MNLLELLTRTNYKWGQACKGLSPLFTSIGDVLENEYNSYNIYPPKDKIFNAFKIDPEDVKIICLLQDPYSGHNQADGMALSCQTETPPSLQVIFNELERTYHRHRIISDLSDWRDQGVLLLNTILTVRRGLPLSHSNLKWQEFTNRVIKSLGNKGIPILAMGSEAQTLVRQLDVDKKFIVFIAHHPASDARGNSLKFYGSGIFHKCNEYLKSQGKPEIKWLNESNSTKSTTDAVLTGFD